MGEQLDRLRSICLSLPDVTEKISHGEPAWFVKKRLFATFAGEHHDNRIAVWCAAPEGAQQALIESDSTRYFLPPTLAREAGSAYTLTFSSTEATSKTH